WETSARLGIFSYRQIKAGNHQIIAPVFSPLWLGQHDTRHVFMANVFYAHLHNKLHEYALGAKFGHIYFLTKDFKVSFIVGYQHYKMIFDSVTWRINRLDFSLGLGF
ncbi:MAG: hypothetical protein WCG27_09210, partial [Pseudomonadota bacterium]